jgi:hypothetical protein
MMSVSEIFLVGIWPLGLTVPELVKQLVNLGVDSDADTPAAHNRLPRRIERVNNIL